MTNYYRQKFIDALGLDPFLLRDKRNGKIVGIRDADGGEHFFEQTSLSNLLSSADLSISAKDYHGVYGLYGLAGNTDGAIIYIGGYYRFSQYTDSAPRGGNAFVWSGSTLKSLHNGFDIISPTVPNGGTYSDLEDFLNGAGETDSGGVGCWLRVHDSAYFEMCGALGGGSIDDTLAIQKFVNSVDDNGYECRGSDTVYKLTSQISVFKSITLSGVGCSYQEGSTSGVKGRGTWFYLAHTGKGIELNGASFSGGVLFKNFGTYRDQPVAGVGWTPTAHNYDIYINATDTKLENLMLWNPTKGVMITNAGTGRLEIDGLRGQPFQEFVRVDKSADTTKINNVHAWAFYSGDSNIWDYQKSNLDAIYLERCDNPLLNNIFTIFARSAIRMGQNAHGKTSKLHLVNADLDRGKYGIWVDSTCNGVTAQLDNVSCQAELTATGSRGLFVEGTNTLITCGNLDLRNYQENGVRVEGSGNKVYVNHLTVDGYNLALASHEAVYCADGNDIRISGYPNLLNGNSGPRYSTTGNIYVDEWRTYTPVITATSGTITTVGTVTGKYKIWNDTVHVMLSITITTNGAGAGGVTATLPIAAVGQPPIGYGRIATAPGVQLQAIGGVASSSISIYKYDNSYPGADGATMHVHITYRIA